MHLACEHTKQASTLTATAAAAMVRIGNSLQLADSPARQMKKYPQNAADRASEPRGACLLAQQGKARAAWAGLQPFQVRANGQVGGEPLGHQVILGRCAAW